MLHFLRRIVNFLKLKTRKGKGKEKGREKKGEYIERPVSVIWTPKKNSPGQWNIVSDQDLEMPDDFYKIYGMISRCIFFLHRNMRFSKIPPYQNLRISEVGCYRDIVLSGSIFIPVPGHALRARTSASIVTWMGLLNFEFTISMARSITFFIPWGEMKKMFKGR